MFSFTISYLWAECLRASANQFDYESRFTSFSRLYHLFCWSRNRNFKYEPNNLNIGVLYVKYYRSIGIIQALTALGMRFASSKDLHFLARKLKLGIKWNLVFMIGIDFKYKFQSLIIIFMFISYS